MIENFLKKHFNKILFVLILIIAGFIYACAKEDIVVWIAGKYSISCYPEGYENKNIKIPIEFTNLDKCLRFINVNKE